MGIVTIATPPLGFGAGLGDLVALAYALLAAAGLAVSNVVMKTIRSRIDPLVAMAAQLLLGALPLAILALLTEQPSKSHPSPGFVPALVLLALPGCGARINVRARLIQIVALYPGTALSYWRWF